MAPAGDASGSEGANRRFATGDRIPLLRNPGMFCEGLFDSGILGIVPIIERLG
jgi:hypothetical protein